MNKIYYCYYLIVELGTKLLAPAEKPNNIGTVVLNGGVVTVLLDRP